MDDIHGVDVSWLHKSSRDHNKGKGAGSETRPRSRSGSPAPRSEATVPLAPARASMESSRATDSQAASSKQPRLLSRSASERVVPQASSSNDAKSSRRPGWLSGLGSRFASSQVAPVSPVTTSKLPNSPVDASASAHLNKSPTTSAPAVSGNEGQRDGKVSNAPGAPTQQKSGFLSSALRRLSTSQPAVNTARATPGSGSMSLAPRQILNRDQGRDRCTIQELNASKLKRVAFRVDVEIAGPPRFMAEEEEEALDLKKKKPRDNKLKEKGEGEALKHPDAVKHEKETTGRVKASGEVVGRDAETGPPQSGNNTSDNRRLIPTRLQIGKNKTATQQNSQDTAFHKGDELDDLYGVSPKPRGPPNVASPTTSSSPRKASLDRLFEGGGLDDLYGVSRPTLRSKSPVPKSRVASADDDFSDGEHGLDTFYGGTVKKVRSNSASTQQKPEPVRATADDSWGGDELSDLFGVSSKAAKKRVTSPKGSPRLQDVARRGDSREYFNTPTNPQPPNTVNAQTPSINKDPYQNAPAADNPQIAQTAPRNIQTPAPQHVPAPANAASLGTTTDPTIPQRVQDRPTTDPLRMYRRCCQLREAPVLKRITEQLGATMSYESDSPGVVNCLDLTGSRMQLADMICLGDWLAISPVKRLILEDANLTDEGLRVLLAGLLAAKLSEHGRKRGRSSPTQLRQQLERKTPGVVERISLKNNQKITREGWKHICCFLHMSKTIKAIDVSLIPFPASPPPQTTSSQVDKRSAGVDQVDIAEILYKSIADRAGGSTLEEFYMSECNLTTNQVRKVVDAATASGLSRLGLAGNHLTEEALEHVASYVRSGVCKALDIGGNDLRHALGPLTEAFHRDSPFWALSLANCNLETADLLPLFSGLLRLPDFRFLDLSHNHELFTGKSSALASLRKYLPQLSRLRRIHLLDVNMSPADAIGLAEIIPEGRNLNHISILENPKLTALAHAKDVASQEEACALYASMMTASRISRTLICVDMDVPAPGISQINSALAKQTIAYCLRNLERITALEAFSITDPASVILADTSGGTDIEVPDVLSHIVGQIEGESDHHEQGQRAPDSDYIVGGVGVVKALDYLMGQKASDLRRQSKAHTGTHSPNPMMNAATGEVRVKDMSRTLLASARKIRTRIQPSLERESNRGDDLARRRLVWLNQMLDGMIGRFEEEFPETRVSHGASIPTAAPMHPDQEPVDVSSSPPRSRTSSFTSAANASPDLASSISSLTTTTFYEPASPTSPLEASHRRPSGTSLHARALGNEEAGFLRLGQRFRREVMPPRGTQDYLHGTSTQDTPEAEHIAALRAKLEELGGDEIRARVMQVGLEGALREWNESAEGLKRLKDSDPEEFRRFREMQRHAQMMEERHIGGASQEPAAGAAGISHIRPGKFEL